jgi:hypothetical protein
MRNVEFALSASLYCFGVIVKDDAGFGLPSAMDAEAQNGGSGGMRLSAWMAGRTRLVVMSPMPVTSQRSIPVW